MEQSTEEEPMVDVGTTEVEADMENTSGDLAGTGGLELKLLGIKSVRT